MVSGPRDEFDAIRTALDTIGRPFYIGEQPGSAQTMKLANNILAANVLVATAEVVVMGVKAGLDPAVMIEVLNAGSGATSASRDKFPRAILPRTFDYGFATGLMVKDVRLYLDEARALGVPVDVAETVGRLWEATARDQGPDSDFTAVILSPRFVAQGPWAKEEYRTALSRQVAAKRVVLLPVLLEQCDIPALLTSKKYADFTRGFDDGFKSLAFSIAKHKR